ncbi:MAG: endopeptidase La [Campylobacteraceae bacterium]|nr:endopeptidase La [Campylobacteraceae bacterium]
MVEDDNFIYPFMICPIFIGNDEKNILAVDEAQKNNSLILVCFAKPNEEGKREFDAVYDSGVIGTIMRKTILPDGRVKILFQGIEKGKILKQIGTKPLTALVDLIKTEEIDSIKTEALLSILRESVGAFSQINNSLSPDFLKAVEENSDINRICDLIIGAIKLKKEQLYELFKETDIKDRVCLLVDYINTEIESAKLQKEIKTKVKSTIDTANREYFLREQLRQIQKELGMEPSQADEDLENYRQKLEAKKPFMGDDAYKEIKKQLDKLSHMRSDSPDANMLRTYLELVLDIPFEISANEQLDINEVKKQLDDDHYSLEKPKQRIEEYFAVKELLSRREIKDKECKGAIICFVGPPGVGKTSLANSIAKALKRKLIRIALGGLEDISEFRGHSRTYIGSKPGRIVHGLIEAGEMNPVMVLDEIDKVSKNYRGDPAAVLLEVLDPEQNNKFRDYYLNFNLDISNVVFIATANDISQVPAPLRDRMEFIYLSSYTPQEKYEIAKKYLIPQEIKKHGLKDSEVAFTKSALMGMIESYTRESGVRNLRRRIADILRKVAKQILLNNNTEKITIDDKDLKEYLGKTVFEIEESDKSSVVGQVNGLAWTSVGGDVFKIEAIKIQGRGLIQLTGSLGEVMKESAKIAQSVVQVLIDNKKIDIDIKSVPLTQKEKEEGYKAEESDIYRRYDIHLHVPEGATPKDGPSAGITIATAIASILSDKKVRGDVAMTGELTLTGKVLPIGGLKEKLIAAYKAKIKTVLIPKKNFERDLDEVPDEIKKNMQILPVTKIEEVLEIILKK